jgi:hypothetical protein
MAAAVVRIDCHLPSIYPTWTTPPQLDLQRFCFNAGAANEQGYFEQICTLAARGTELIDNTQPLQKIASELSGHGLPVFCIVSRSLASLQTAAVAITDL